jgi:hypothetical protein
MCRRGPRIRTPHCSKMAALFILLRHGGPGLSGLKRSIFINSSSSPIQIFLVDNPILADDECLYSSHPILGRCSDQRESADHHAFYDVVHLAEWCRRPLPFSSQPRYSNLTFSAHLNVLLHIARCTRLAANFALDPTFASFGRGGRVLVNLILSGYLKSDSAIQGG